MFVVFLSGLPPCLGAGDAIVGKVGEAFRKRFPLVQGINALFIKKTRASRTWQMIDRHGIIKAVERAVNRADDPTGFTSLIKMGMEDLAFELIVIRYAEVFSPETVARAKARLQKWMESDPPSSCKADIENK